MSKVIVRRYIGLLSNFNLFNIIDCVHVYKTVANTLICSKYEMIEKENYSTLTYQVNFYKQNKIVNEPSHT